MSNEAMIRGPREGASVGRRRARWSAVVAVLLLGAAPATAQSVDPAIYIDFDTSGSMLGDTDGTPCDGDGSLEHPHDTGCTSRLYTAKNAISTSIVGYSEVRWGLARFSQVEDHQHLCLCDTQGDVDPSEEPDSCDGSTAYDHDLDWVTDPVCINYGGGFGGGTFCNGSIACCDVFDRSNDLTGADIVVALADFNETLILSWLDHQETSFQNGTEPGTGNHCWGGSSYGDCELRGVGGTPIAGSLRDLRDQLSNEDLPNDPRRGCRPYSIILLTDGDESCELQADAEAAAADLLSTPDQASSCGSSADCPPNSWCDNGMCQYEVKTYVIAFALSDTTNADSIALAGGTGAAIPASNETEIISAMAGIISESMVFELCNGIDDDCDGAVDEDYPVGQTCDNGLLGVCYEEGVYICDPGDDTQVVCDLPGIAPGPTEEICDGLDNDCDGEVDEDGACTCNGPEVCNGLDDYCDGWATQPEGAEDSRVGQACGTDVGACESGTTYCWQDPNDPAVVEIRCSGVSATAEVCDDPASYSDPDDADQNCNGVNNDGIAPVSCSKTNSYGTCDGYETCDPDGVWTCWARDAAPEACNDVDDDCDGDVDEGLSRYCEESNAYGTCTGTEVCTAGAWGGCNALTPEQEVCDGVDNDCDGQVDEGLTRSCSVSNGYGTCTGTETCSVGSWGGCTAATPAEEICNDADDDCDGSIDENLSQSCYSGPAGTAGVGPCQEGTQTCSSGAWGSCTGEVLPSTEVCDGVDNDCNGTADDGLGQTTCGLGVCEHTVDNCDSGTPQTCDPLQGASPESCDGLDNDCDGVADGLLRACYTPSTGCTETSPGVYSCVGVCNAGTQSCPVDSGSWGTCQYETGPDTEVCDGQDNDCDGSIDENLTQACYPPGYGATTGCTAPGSCVGVCAEGSRSCSSGTWGSCSGAVTPSAETCDGADNDCDGTADEGLSRSCQVSNAEGTCTGTETCSAGSWGGCTAATPAPETCDGVDNDCDGQTDEGLGQSCYSGPAGTENVGACHGGTRSCVGGSYGACQGEVTPTAEICDGVDNDCDGQTDEDAGGNPLSQPCYGGPAGTDGVGECHGGQRLCSGGSWSACTGQVVPAQEVCDGLDNDCDGQTDEGLGQTTCGLGHCQHTVDNCDSGVPQTCDPYQGASPEICDGADNDCDGVVDGITRTCYTPSTGCTETSPGVWSCQGLCAPGVDVCASTSGGTWSGCQFEVGPAAELCDGLDNDCDGDVDEDAQGNPLTEACYSPGSGPTTGCTYDAGTQSWTCLGLCTAGTRTCSGATWGTCQGEVTPAVETCDGSDNDCDGDIDEPQDIPGLNQPCSTALGRCTPGILRCIDGQELCEGGDGPFPGECNGEDDDCDGQIDEADEVADYVGEPCGDSTGLCTPGQTDCVGGSLVCVGGTQPTVEVCDGLDNDCDGEVDDFAECPPSYYCVQGDCRIECDPNAEFACPGSYECLPVQHEGQSVAVCLPDTGGECGGETCPEGWECVDDQCVDPCDPNPCQPWEECHSGACVDVSCSGIGRSCPSGEYCAGHECVPDPCADLDCEPSDGYCARDCDAQACTASCEPLCLCAPDELCGPEATCEPDPCAEADCELGERCNPGGGLCEPDPCAQVMCGYKERCFEGECLADPCGQVDCPPYFHCEVETVTGAGGDPEPNPVCRADEAYFEPGDPGEDLTAIGGGGRARQSAGHRSGATPLLWLLGLGVLLWRRRRQRSPRHRDSPASEGTSPRGHEPRRRGALAISASTVSSRLILMLTVTVSGTLALTAGAGCKVDSWNTGEPGRWHIPDGDLPDGWVPDGGADAAVDACVAATEICNQQDDDCDGEVDEDFDLQTDPFNCGSCGTICEFPFAFATCEDATCLIDRSQGENGCLPGHWDLNGVEADGCEYGCFRTNDGTEVCDGLDNDCDGEVDEDFDLQSDPLHCGQCNNACSFFQGVGACVSGQCTLSSCRGGYADPDGNPSNGCECQLTLTEGTTVCVEGQPGTCAAGEVCADADADGTAHCAPIPDDGCDGVDNDCDGQTDEDAPAQLGGTGCYTHPVGCTETSPGVYSCSGQCQAGVPTCSGGNVVCGGQVAPAGEVCDGLDNDCNGTVDDGFDKDSDPANCGGCGVQCAATVVNAVPGCSGGQCVVVACLPGYYDLNSDPADGCEYACTLSNGGMEACGDGVDNDCNGQVDDGFDLQNDPTNCGSCGHSCEAAKPFGTQTTGCAGGVCQLVCQADHYDLDGDLATAGESGTGCEYACTLTNGGTEACDGLDNDCDGTVDEGFDLDTDLSHCGSCGNDCTTQAGAHSVASSCSNGTCQYSCQSGYVDLDGDVSLGAAGTGCEYGCTVSNGGVEICDGLDNDCDGDTDEAPGGGVLTQPCYSGPGGTAGVGACQEGTQTCSGGSWGACDGEVVPQAETCDGVDNDCDSLTDEDVAGDPLSRSCYSGPAGTAGVGLCQEGTEQCSGGLWGSCQGEVTPQLDVCDSQDNDCDGSADEDYDLTTDLTNCGGCGHACPDHAGANSFAASCTSSVCVYACQSGHYDVDGDLQSGDAGTGCEYACTLTNGGVEACGDGVDNDCDGQTDEGFDLQTDPDNCGSCGYSCAANTPYGASSTGCSSGSCTYVCQSGYHDLDGDLSAGGAGNGCEYACSLTNGGTEACDDVDNDCDGQIDEDFAKDTNPDHCGSCGYRCADHRGANSEVLGCTNGVCQYGCLTGWVDLNGDVSQGDAGDGCEYACTVSNGGTEICDGDDNDCDGQTDEDGSGSALTRTCYSPGYGATTGCDAPGSCTGTCREGTETCSGGGWGACEGEVVPQSELCDGLDNDCDGSVDEDFDTTSDINHCGGCNQSCWSSAPANSYPDACNSGVCHFVCLTGYNDLNGDLQTSGGDGCEYTCPVSPPVEEYCDGKDNDCDGAVDEDLTAPSGLCYQGTDGPSPPSPGTDENNPCQGVTALCTDPDGSGGWPHDWYCQYPASVETDPANPNQLLGYETLCNGWDGDCDGFADDGFHVGDSCDDGGVGACRGTGTVQCKSDQSGSECNITSPGDSPADEVCDGVDNDCDGLTDETAYDNDPANDPSGVQPYVVDDVVTVVTPGGVTTYVYQHEASHPEATSGDGGPGTAARACSRAAVIPWSFLTYAQAARACARAGMRLCRPDEWLEACEGSLSYTYPYGDTYEPLWCNGYDNGVVAPEPTGTQTSCDSGYGAEDLSGNLREWTADEVDTTSDGRRILRLRGGSYLDYEAGLTCDFGSSAYVEDSLADHVGFRCCSTCGNGTRESWEVCDPSAGDANCHPAHCGPLTCGDGTLDAGEQCDDGNLLPEDGCASDCTRETAVLLHEEFSSCLPAGWAVDDGQSDGLTWECCPGGTCSEQTDNTTSSPSGGTFMKVDSDEDGSGVLLQEGLVTPAFDLSAYIQVTLSFYHHYNDYNSSDFAAVQYSVNGQAGPWYTLTTYTADVSGQETLDVSAEVAGESNVAFRFYYDDGDTWAWYWKVDDVRVDVY